MIADQREQDTIQYSLINPSDLMCQDEEEWMQNMNQDTPLSDIENDDLEFEEDTEENAYGLEGEYKTDFMEWQRNYSWFKASFQEWIKEKKEYEEEIAREMQEMYEDNYSDDGGRYYRRYR